MHDSVSQALYGIGLGAHTVREALESEPAQAMAPHDEPDISLEMKEALYRIAQEALHNIIKHARASTVVLRLIKQEGEILLEVHDNGKGFDPAGPFPGHLGMSSMQERAAKVGGTFVIKSTAGQGTDIPVRVPEHSLVKVDNRML